MTLTLGSLFSGYGGLDLAVQMALGPMRTAWVSDIEPGPKAILAQRFPGVPNLGDITAIDWAAVEPVDVLVGGSPCQDLSYAGQRRGMEPGTRSGLWESMAHAIEQLRPRLVVWENVKGALSANAYSDMGWSEGLVDTRTTAQRPKTEKDKPLRALGRVLGDLADLGYDAEWKTVRASDVGAPHQRERLFVIAWPRDAGKPRLVGRSFTADTVRGRNGWWAITPGRGEGTQPDPSLDWTDPRIDGAPVAYPSGTGCEELRREPSALPEYTPPVSNRHMLPTPQARDHKGIPGDVQ